LQQLFTFDTVWGLPACRISLHGYFLTAHDTPLFLIISNGVTEWWPLFFIWHWKITA
jgi:hypothetical protein